MSRRGLCEARGCKKSERLYRFPYWQPTLSKMICRKCRNKAGRYVVDDNEPVFLLTLEDKATLAAMEMVREEESGAAMSIEDCRNYSAYVVARADWHYETDPKTKLTKAKVVSKLLATCVTEVGRR